MNSSSEGFWNWVLEVLKPIRIPLFFAISGYLGVRVIQRSWKRLVLSRSLNLYYLYVVWLIVQTMIFPLLPDINTAVARTPIDFIKQLTYAPTNLWFLLALACYFVVAKLCQKIPAIALGAAALLSLAATSSYLPSVLNQTAIPDNLVWFLLGVYYPNLIAFYAQTPHLARALVSFAVFVPTFLLSLLTDGVLFASLRMASSATGVALTIAIVSWCAKLWLVRTGLSSIGRRTLPIYVTQMLFIALVSPVLSLLAHEFKGQAAAGFLLPPIVVSIVIALGMGMYALLHRPLWFLYQAPWQRKLKRPGFVGGS